MGDRRWRGEWKMEDGRWKIGDGGASDKIRFMVPMHSKKSKGNSP
jgi:hypothetical protein